MQMLSIRSISPGLLLLGALGLFWFLRDDGAEARKPMERAGVGVADPAPASERSPRDPERPDMALGNAGDAVRSGAALTTESEVAEEPPTAALGEEPKQEAYVPPYDPDQGLPPFPIAFGYESAGRARITLESLRRIILEDIPNCDHFGDVLSEDLLRKVRSDVLPLLEAYAEASMAYDKAWTAWLAPLAVRQPPGPYYTREEFTPELIQKLVGSLTEHPRYIYREWGIDAGAKWWVFIATPEQHPDLYRKYFGKIEASQALMEAIHAAVLRHLRG
jgi:hypothetical protein